jgi:hypothetical protein
VLLHVDSIKFPEISDKNIRQAFPLKFLTTPMTHHILRQTKNRHKFNDSPSICFLDIAKFHW